MRIPGKKALIGDNLSSHFSADVLEKCKENDILFICLPPNATHLCQPLDVALFAPMKRKWREILHDYKTKNPSASAVQKPKFPALFKRLLTAMSGTLSSSMISGFRTCGIYPVNRDVVKAKLQFNQIDEAPDNSDVISFLRQQRGIAPPTDETGPSASHTPKRERKSSNDVIPGRAVNPDDVPTLSTTSKRGRSLTPTAIER